MINIFPQMVSLNALVYTHAWQLIYWVITPHANTSTL